VEGNSQPEAEPVLLAYDYDGGSIGRRTSVGGAIAIASQVLKLLIQLGGLAILARLLKPADFGLVAMAATISAFVSLFGDLGLSTATLQRKAVTQTMVSTLFYLGLAVAVTITVAVAALSPLAARFYGDGRIAAIAAGLALAIPLAAAGAQQNALMARGMRWGAIQITSIGGQVAGVAVAVSIAWLTDLGYWALVAQAVAGQSCTLILQWSLCPWRPSLALDVRGTFAEIGFGANVTGFGVANYFHRQIDNVMIGKRWGESELGFYSRAYALIVLPMMVVNNAVGSAVIPLLSRVQDDAAAWRGYFVRALSLTCFGSYCVACVLTVNSHEIIDVLLGPEWDYCGTILFYLALSLFPITPMNAMGWLFISLDRSGRWFRWGLLTSVLFPVAYFAGLGFRSVGVAIAYTLAVAALAVPCIVYATKGTAITAAEIGKAVRAPLLAGAATVAAGLALRPLWQAMPHALALVAGVVATTALFGIVSVALLFIDKEQERQRRLLWSLLTGHPRAVPIDR